MHYTPMPDFNEADIRRFWSCVDQDKRDKCWPWLRTKFVGGYGQIKVAKRNLKAHRVAYFLHYHADPADKLVCHTCDNPTCCNPHHLFLGSELDNAADMKAKGRHKAGSGDTHGSKTHPERFARGERVHGARLTADEVRYIRATYSQGGRSQQSLADQFGIDRQTVGLIIRNKNWRHIADEDGQGSLSINARRGRPGERNPSAKLTADDVRTIRSLHADGMSGVDIAKQFCVTKHCISDITRRKSWRHVE